MRRLLVALATTILLASGCSSSDGTVDAIPKPGQPTIAVDTPDLVAAKAAAGVEPCVPGTASGALPAVTLPCLGGGPSVDLSTLTGPMVISVWQSACGPCRIEMPVLQQLHATYGAQVAVLGVDLLDTLPGLALEQAGKRGATYPELADFGGEMLQEPEFARAARGLPYLAFVDAAGEVVGEHSGGVTSLEELTGLVDDYLGLDLSSGTRARP